MTLSNDKCIKIIEVNIWGLFSKKKCEIKCELLNFDRKKYLLLIFKETVQSVKESQVYIRKKLVIYNALCSRNFQNVKVRLDFIEI